MIEGDGCRTIMNVTIAFTVGDGIAVQNTGTTVLDKILVESTFGAGILISPTIGELLVIVSRTPLLVEHTEKESR